jgi:protein-S-isoprenylcysteine O-methyltransferase Ste14
MPLQDMGRNEELVPRKLRQVNALELKVPPPLVALLLAAGMWLAAATLPALAIAFPWRHGLAIGIAGIGVGFALTGVYAFHRAGTTVNPMQPAATSSMVTSGVYRVSRNPMYVGLLLALAGWAVFLSHALPFLFLPAFVLYMNRFQIAPEERALSAKFGDEYEAYERAVRRWL